MTTPKKRPAPVPRAFQISHNLPPGAQLALPPAALKDLVRLFGEQALARVGVKRDEPG